MLRDFKIGDPLHIGVSNSRGRVYDFDENGMNFSSNREEWNHCLSISLDEFIDSNLIDSILESVESSRHWISQK